jgi:DNA-directed RNA polymerase specialized sigma24 family protein
MRGIPRDLAGIPESEDARLPDAMLLTIALSGRGHPDDHARAARAWQHLVARRFDRIQIQIRAWRWPERDVRVHPDDRDDAFSRAWQKAENMFHTHREPAVAAFDAGLRKAVEYACMDECRRRMRREQLLAGSLDEPVAGDEGADERGRFDRAVLARQREMEDARAVAGDLLEDVRECVARMANEDMRVVLQRTLDGADVEAIMAERGLSRDNVYQLRHRAMRQIRKEVLSDG